MVIAGRKLITKFTKGDATLDKAFNEFLEKVALANWENDAQLKTAFPDADRIFGNFYVFNVGSNRNLSLVLFRKGQLELIWVGNHNDYESTLKNNKDTIRKFLKKKGYDV